MPNPDNRQAGTAARAAGNAARQTTTRQAAARGTAGQPRLRGAQRQRAPRAAGRRARLGSVRWPSGGSA
jgi:hypothetical protein